MTPRNAPPTFEPPRNGHASTWSSWAPSSIADGCAVTWSSGLSSLPTTTQSRDARITPHGDAPLG